MKPIYLLLFILLLCSCVEKTSKTTPELEDLYARLDATINRSDDYDKNKEARIARLKKEYDLSADGLRRTAIIDSLINEFAAYNADSTLYYISYNLQRPDIKKIPGEHTRLLIKRADQYAHAGLFPDALEVLSAIPRDSLNENLMEEYYSAYCSTYQYLSEYTYEHEPAQEYERKRGLYADSLKQTVKPGTFSHLCFVMAEEARSGNSKKAIETLEKHLKEYKSGTREFSILASTLAFIYKTIGNSDEYKRYLLLSAISDVEGSVKENMSFRAAATVMFEDGDIDRANLYLKKSIADANFYSAMMRNAQSGKVLPVIDEAYTTVQNRLTSRLRIMVAISCVLLLVVIAALFYILRQLRRLRKAHQEIRSANEELSELSGRLRTMNDELEKRNRQLADFNKTKEEYAGLFMEYCSSAISTLQRYQQSLRVSAAQGGNRTGLLKKLESSEISDQLLKKFYEKFDEAILNIYPSFIEKFNSLLKPGDQVVLKTGEILNTELRLFALIRMGIDDSAKIAEFLRCSISTVYTYRSKMRKRALNPDEFEMDVKKID